MNQEGEAMYPDVETIVTLSAWRRADIEREVRGVRRGQWAHTGQAAEEGRHGSRGVRRFAVRLRGAWLHLAKHVQQAA